MKETSEFNIPPSRQALRPPTTNTERNGTPLTTRHSQTRPLTNVPTPLDHGGQVKPGLRLTSLSALYQPAFKPYSFSHMYNTKYNADFEGRYWPRPLPDRAASSNFAPIKYRFGSSTYQQHFQKMEPFKPAFVVPYSRHRKNNPQPNMVNSYNYPNGTKWIWKPSSSAGEHTTQSESRPRTQAENHRFHRWYSR